MKAETGRMQLLFEEGAPSCLTFDERHWSWSFTSRASSIFPGLLPSLLSPLSWPCFLISSLLQISRTRQDKHVLVRPVAASSKPGKPRTTVLPQ